MGFFGRGKANRQVTIPYTEFDPLMLLQELLDRGIISFSLLDRGDKAALFKLPISPNKLSALNEQNLESIINEFNRILDKMKIKNGAIIEFNYNLFYPVEGKNDYPTSTLNNSFTFKILSNFFTLKILAKLKDKVIFNISEEDTTHLQDIRTVNPYGLWGMLQQRFLKIADSIVSPTISQTKQMQPQSVLSLAGDMDTVRDPVDELYSMVSKHIYEKFLSVPPVAGLLHKYRDKENAPVPVKAWQAIADCLDKNTEAPNASKKISNLFSVLYQQGEILSNLRRYQFIRMGDPLKAILFGLEKFRNPKGVKQHDIEEACRLGMHQANVEIFKNFAKQKLSAFIKETKKMLRKHENDPRLLQRLERAKAARKTIKTKRITNLAEATEFYQNLHEELEFSQRVLRDIEGGKLGLLDKTLTELRNKLTELAKKDNKVWQPTPIIGDNEVVKLISNDDKDGQPTPIIEDDEVIKIIPNDDGDGQPPLASQPTQVVNQDKKAEILTDFDGTLTAMKGRKLIDSDFYNSLMAVPNTHYTAQLKPQEKLVGIMQKEFHAYEAANNGARDPRRMTLAAVQFLKEMLAASDVGVTIISKNQKEYITAMLIYEGFLSDEIDKITIYGWHNYEYSKGHCAKTHLEGKNPSVVWIFDDDAKDAAKMKGGAVEANVCNKILKVTLEDDKLPGGFDWPTYTDITDPYPPVVVGNSAEHSMQASATPVTTSQPQKSKEFSIVTYRGSVYSERITPETDEQSRKSTTSTTPSSFDKRSP